MTMNQAMDLSQMHPAMLPLLAMVPQGIDSAIWDRSGLGCGHLNSQGPRRFPPLTPSEPSRKRNAGDKEEKDCEKGEDDEKKAPKKRVKREANPPAVMTVSVEEFLIRAAANEPHIYAQTSATHDFGEGWFVARPFACGEPLFELRGEALTDNGFEKRYGTRNKTAGPFAFPVKPSGYIDCRNNDQHAKSWLLRDRLHIGREGLENNCRLEQHFDRLVVVATTNLPRGAELFCDLSDAYWGKPLHRMWRLIYFYLASSPDQPRTAFEVMSFFSSYPFST
jgi:hypothetical protein